AEERTVDRLFLARIDQGPAPFFTGAAQLDMAIGPALDALVDQGKFLFQFLAECRQRLFDWPDQDRRADFTEHRILLLPALIADQIVFETAELGAVPDKNVARLERVAQQPIDE